MAPMAWDGSRLASVSSPPKLFEELATALDNAKHHRRQEMVSMWLFGEYANQLLYDHGHFHNFVAAQAGVPMTTLTRALTIRATYAHVRNIPEGTP